MGGGGGGGGALVYRGVLTCASNPLCSTEASALLSNRQAIVLSFWSQGSSVVHVEGFLLLLCRGCGAYVNHLILSKPEDCAELETGEL